MSGNIYIVGVGMTQFGRHPERSIDSLANEALEAALSDGGATRSLIEQVYYSGATQGALQGQYAIPGQIVLSKIGLTGLPVFNIENRLRIGHIRIPAGSSGASCRRMRRRLGARRGKNEYC